jgi:hypothetical protein
MKHEINNSYYIFSSENRLSDDLLSDGGSDSIENGKSIRARYNILFKEKVVNYAKEKSKNKASCVLKLIEL